MNVGIVFSSLVSLAWCRGDRRQGTAAGAMVTNTMEPRDAARFQKEPRSLSRLTPLRARILGHGRIERPHEVDVERAFVESRFKSAASILTGCRNEINRLFR
jgi:hypothetical protein